MVGKPSRSKGRRVSTSQRYQIKLIGGFVLVILGASLLSAFLDYARTLGLPGFG